LVAAVMTNTQTRDLR